MIVRWNMNESTVRTNFHLDIRDGWPADLLTILNDACVDLVAVFGGVVPAWMHGMKVRVEEMAPLGLTSVGLVRLNPVSPSKWTVVHEFGHAWDFSSGRRNSLRMQWRTGSHGLLYPLRKLYPDNPAYWYHPGSPPPPCGTDRNFTYMEDFAESVAAYVYPERAKQKAAGRNYPYSNYSIDNFLDTTRGQFIKELVLNSVP